MTSDHVYHQLEALLLLPSRRRARSRLPYLFRSASQVLVPELRPGDVHVRCDENITQPLGFRSRQVLRLLIHLVRVEACSFSNV